MSEVVVYPLEYEAARKWLVIHSLYGLGSSFAGALDPERVFSLMNPLLVPVEHYTGLVSSTLRFC